MGDIRLRRGFLIRVKTALNLLLIPFRVACVFPKMNKLVVNDWGFYVVIGVG